MFSYFSSAGLVLAAGGHVPQHFYEEVGGILVFYYIALALMNAGASLYLWQTGQSKKWFTCLGHDITNVLIWLGLAVVCVGLAPLAGTGNPQLMPSISEHFRQFVNNSTGPVVYTLGTTAVLVVLYAFREFFVRPAVAWILLNASLIFMGMAMTDMNFYAIVAKPDNVPIVMLIFLLGFFTWLGTYRAVLNDKRHEQGLGPLEKEDNEKVLVWPDLVYTELICMIALTAFLILWAVLLTAPLEEPASAVKTPNPSKAPWYFLGLQEMLVYYDPWMAGVVLPSIIVGGLMAIPFIDFNKAGNGYYTIKERKFSYLVFQVGFLELWITLIVLGTFLRGPNWNFFGPFEYWDAHKVEALNNINLSDHFWGTLLNRGLPKPAPGSSFGVELGTILVREAPGILLVLGYFIALPPLMAVTIFRKFYLHMGLIRFMVLSNLLLFMAALPVKMVLRWVFNLKYLIAIPEYFLNF
ncbi:MAG: hypothetical protein KDA42_13935 [Planctomycetales bacterium]|nr:hypothetical protein [Planctomycetales bacterium]